MSAAGTTTKYEKTTPAMNSSGVRIRKGSTTRFSVGFSAGKRNAYPWYSSTGRAIRIPA